MVDLEMLLDEREITRALGRFARILDRKEWGSLRDVFAEHVQFNYGSGEGSGIAALEAQMRRFLDVCGATQHLIGSIMIDVDGDRAVSRAYVQARHQRRDDPVGAVFDSTGEYVDVWNSTSEGWRIVRRDATWFLHSGDPGVLAVTTNELG